MSFTGHRRQGYCLLTIGTSPDGSETETPQAGKITQYPVSFTGSWGTDSTEKWAGDRKVMESHGEDGTVEFVLEQLELEDEAALGGHDLDETGGMVEHEDDAPPYIRFAAIGTGRKEVNGKATTFYRVAEYYKCRMSGVVDDVFNTRTEGNVTYNDHSLAGKCYYNRDGNRRRKVDFDTFEAAVAEMKKFLNVT